MNIVFYMNCHGLELKNYFDNFLSDNNQLKLIFTYQCINEFGENSIPTYINKIFSEADILFYNPVNEKHKVWSSDSILKLVSKECQCFEIPYYKFFGYFYNDETRVNESKFGTLVSEALEQKLVNLYSLRNNLSLSTIKKISNHIINIYDYDYVKSKVIQLDDDFKNFRNLEKNTKFKMNKYLEKNFKYRKVFYNYNHPSSNFWFTLFKLILEHLNINLNTVYELKSVMKELIEEPISYSNKIAGWIEFDINNVLTFNNTTIDPLTYYSIHFYSKYINDTLCYSEIISLIK